MKKIIVFISARPQYFRLKSLMRKFNESPELDMYLMVGGSALSERAGRLDTVIENDGFFIYDKIYFQFEGDDPCCMTKCTSVYALALSDIFRKINPEFVLVHADRYEQLAVAMAAAYANVLLVHTQGGEVTGSIDDTVRDMITQAADIHFPCTEKARERIIKMICNDNSNQWKRDKVFNVGCPSIDLILETDFFKALPDLNEKYHGVGCRIDYSKPYILVLFHPDTDDYGMTEYQTVELVEAVKKLNYQTIWLWPNLDAGSEGISKTIRRYRERGELENVRLEKNFTPEDFVHLASLSACILGNTSFGIREGAFLNLPYVCVGDRQKDREHSTNVMFADYHRDIIYDRARKIMNRVPDPNANTDLYGDGTSCDKIVKILTAL